MKCPKCGIEYKIGGTDVNGNAVCKACQLKELKDLGFLNDKNIPQTISSNKIIIETEITTAEKLLWLVGESNEGVFSIIQARDVIMLNFVIGKNHINAMEETLTEAIKQAYDWAKQEEQNAKN